MAKLYFEDSHGKPKKKRLPRLSKYRIILGLSVALNLILGLYELNLRYKWLTF